ncbi:PLP-dependent transferase [Ceraceosorus guamensis]|uniref:PLP-dependent transferase n=1 Tax=Ceraceosorus guamensis TaxID=1522189 RepID=A0A316W8D5_9BASI|nr:PLP-dependent transferase [Ceraceosorus guamensis]PWN46129.1 PLP-dependent transferase [Ceraceosorus guamensis]
MDVETFRRAAHAAVDEICDHYLSMRDKPVTAQVKPGFLTDALPDAAPSSGQDWSRINEDFHSLVMPGMTQWQHPKFMAYYPANVSFEGILGDMWAAALTNPGFNWICSPSVTELELKMMDWMAEAFHLDPAFKQRGGPQSKGGGLIFGSASEATLTVAIAARDRALRHLTAASGQIEPSREWAAEATGKLVMYGSTETHSVGSKAAQILGLRFRALPVTLQNRLALRGDTLAAAIKEDVSAGLVPFMVCATLGTTSTSAVDALDEIASAAIMPTKVVDADVAVHDHLDGSTNGANGNSTDCARSESLPPIWLHVDAAYAGPALCLPEIRTKYQKELSALNAKFDSISLNMHKWGLVNFDCSPLWVKDRAQLAASLTVTPEYLKTTAAANDPSVLDLRNYQISLGRRFRSLKVWFVLRSHGIEGLRQHLRDDILLAERFKRLIEDEGDPWQLVEFNFALLVIRLKPASTDADPDSRTRALWAALEKRNDELLLTQTSIPGAGFCIRIALGCPRTQERDVDDAFAVLKLAATEAKLV